MKITSTFSLAVRTSMALCTGLLGITNGRAESSRAEHQSDGQQRVTRPNIVLILADDLGYGDVSFMNPSSKIQTPEIDALSRQGVWAVDAHASSSVCSPTRYSLLTGRYNWKSRDLKRRVLMPWAPSAIEDEVTTLPEFLGRHGYRSAVIGKWHLGFNWPWAGGERPPEKEIGLVDSTAQMKHFDWSRPIEGGPIGAGFDYFFGVDCPNFPPYCFIENQRPVGPLVQVRANDLPSLGSRGHMHGDGSGAPVWDLETILPEITSRAEAWIAEAAKTSEPFFLYFSLTSPHTPVVPTKEFQGRSRAGYYGDFVEQTDAAVGRIVEALRRSGQLDNTILIFTSDNGPAEYQRELIQSVGHSPAGPFRGMKWEALEGGHRVPFIVSWPKGQLSGGKKITSLLSTQDLFATIAAALDLELPERVAEDSLNALPSLRDDQPVRQEMTHQVGRGNFALRQGPWVYIRNNWITEPEWYRLKYSELGEPQAPLLFNLDEDPVQKRNLIEKFPQRAQQMEARIRELITPYIPEGGFWKN